MEGVIIPTIISIEIPLPMPLSIFSPSHIAKIQPVTSMTEENINKGPLPIIKALSGTPRAPNPYKYAGA